MTNNTQNKLQVLQEKLQRSINMKKEHIAATREKLISQYEKEFGVTPTHINVW